MRHSTMVVSWKANLEKNQRKELWKPNKTGLCCHDQVAAAARASFKLVCRVRTGLYFLCYYATASVVTTVCSGSFRLVQ